MSNSGWMPANSIGVGDENFHASENVFISGVRPPVPINELSKCKEGGQEKRKAGSGATEQGTDQQGRSGNGEAMNKLNKQVKQVKQGKQVES